MDSLVFIKRHRSFSPGDTVPDTFSEGVIATMLSAGVIGPSSVIEDATPLPKVKAMKRPTRNKSMTGRSVVKDKHDGG